MLGTAKNHKNKRSQSWEQPKIAKTGLPKVGNSKKCQFQLFPTLGTRRIQMWMGKTPIFW